MSPEITLLALAAFGVGIWLTFYRNGGAAAHPVPTYLVRVHVMELDEHGPDRPVHVEEPITVQHLESARRLARRLREEHEGSTGRTYARVTITDEHGNDVPLDG